MFLYLQIPVHGLFVPGRWVQRRKWWHHQLQVHRWHRLVPRVLQQTTVVTIATVRLQVLCHLEITVHHQCLPLVIVNRTRGNLSTLKLLNSWRCGMLNISTILTHQRRSWTTLWSTATSQLHKWGNGWLTNVYVRVTLSPSTTQSTRNDSSGYSDRSTPRHRENSVTIHTAPGYGGRYRCLQECVSVHRWNHSFILPLTLCLTSCRQCATCHSLCHKWCRVIPELYLSEAKTLFSHAKRTYMKHICAKNDIVTDLLKCIYVTVTLFIALVLCYATVLPLLVCSFVDLLLINLLQITFMFLLGFYCSQVWFITLHATLCHIYTSLPYLP